MGQIVKMKSASVEVSYSARVRLQKHEARTATLNQITDAKEWVEQEELKIKRGIHLDRVESEERTVGEAFDRFIRDEKPPRARLLHIIRWREKIGRLFLSAINGVKINDVTARSACNIIH